MQTSGGRAFWAEGAAGANAQRGVGCVSYGNNEMADAGPGEGEEGREGIRSEWTRKPSYAEHGRP